MESLSNITAICSKHHQPDVYDVCGPTVTSNRDNRNAMSVTVVGIKQERAEGTIDHCGSGFESTVVNRSATVISVDGMEQECDEGKAVENIDGCRSVESNIVNHNGTISVKQEFSEGAVEANADNYGSGGQSSMVSQSTLISCCNTVHMICQNAPLSIGNIKGECVEGTTVENCDNSGSDVESNVANHNEPAVHVNLKRERSDDVILSDPKNLYHRFRPTERQSVIELTKQKLGDLYKKARLNPLSTTQGDAKRPTQKYPGYRRTKKVLNSEKPNSMFHSTEFKLECKDVTQLEAVEENEGKNEDKVERVLTGKLGWAVSKSKTKRGGEVWYVHNIPSYKLEESDSHQPVLGPNGQQVLFCRICSVEEDFELHVMKRLHYCTVCYKVFDSDECLQKHIFTHYDKTTFCCRVCYKQFSNQKLLASHMRIHFDLINYMCHICDKLFYTRGFLQAHACMHGTREYFACNICSVTFRKTKQLQSHVVTHFEETEAPFRCAGCHLLFLDIASLKEHVKMHRIYRCHCDQSFSTEWELGDHMHRHTGEKPYKCTVCAKAWWTHSGLVRHRESHVRAERHNCGACRKCFLVKPAIDDVGVLQTNGSKLFKCPVCEKSFAAKEYVIAHLEMHKQEKLQERTNCDKVRGTFADGCSKERDEGQVFRCSLCERKSASLLFIRAHVRFSHPKPNVFICIVCGVTFFCWKELKVHSLSHVASMYKCDVCLRVYQSSFTLKSHRFTCQ